MGSPLPTAPYYAPGKDLAGAEVRPFPDEVPLSVQTRAAEILADPDLQKHKLAFVLTPTIQRMADSGKFDIQVREALVVHLDKGWSFAQFTAWRPTSGEFSAGVEIRKVL